MNQGKVRDILVPVAAFPRLRQEASLREAYSLLHEQHASGGWRFRHMLVYGDDRTVTGILSLQDLLRALMPDYIKATLGAREITGGGPDDSLCQLWQETLDSQCWRLAELPVSSYMTPARHTVGADDPITRAAYLMIAHHVHMLPVLEDGVVAGVVRIVDVFNRLAQDVLRV